MDPSSPIPNLPERIGGLRGLAYNMWWSWHPEARELFRMLDLQLWRESEHRPVRLLSLADPATLASAATDEGFVAQYDAVMGRFRADTSLEEGWFPRRYGASAPTLAYLSAEYGLHVSLPVYAGGLGALAGDYLKECSDLAVPVVAVGIIYSQGYVWQQIREDGWQEDPELTLDRTYDPILPVRDGAGNLLTVQVPLLDPPLYVRVWQVGVGRASLYLMDSNLESNGPTERAITNQLYASGLEQRLRQEIVLGMGGMGVLEALGIRPAALHINEGHPAFALLERMRALVGAGASPEEAAEQVRRTAIFTTHTPVPAGTDVYPFALMDRYFGGYYGRLGLSRQAFMDLGTNPADPRAGFNMTVFSLRMTQHCNAVSRRHCEVARRMWADVWPQKKEAEVPIVAITNGVHLPAWIEPLQLQPLLDRYLGPAWRTEQDRADVWAAIDEIPDAELWHLHQRLKVALVSYINERTRERWQKDRVPATHVVASGVMLDPNVLTLGFARRFTAYKRADLILHDEARLKALLNDPWHPLQIIFAGKAHPADAAGKRLIQCLYQAARDPAFGGRIAFVENYDEQLAQYMVRGVDVWLNTPLPPLEASGTSGMKAGANGVPSLSILDGWWIEGANGMNGWAFGGGEVQGDRTAADAEALYSLLEGKVIPLFYRRSDDEVPHGFVAVMKAAMKSVSPAFSARRMVKEYVQRFYVPALGLQERQ